MSDRLKGITRTSLWKAWKEIRAHLRDCSRRDVADYLEYDIDPEKWIRRLLRELEDGSYEPSQPTRFPLAKSKGFSRRMTMPAIPDLVVYRAVVENLMRRVRGREHTHVYFDRKALAKATEQAASEARHFTAQTARPYGPTSFSRYLTWLRYDQYRKYLIVKKVYPYIVITDITNFFDSILFSRIGNALHGLSAPPQLVGLLFFLLERLSVREAYTESPRIGLPVDEFDCSRRLAHMILFPHDDRMVGLVGEEAYVRWMDDQNIGVKTRAEGLRVLSEVDRSLARLHLTANSAKSKLLSLNEARRHFHLDINARLDRLEKLPSSSRTQRALLGKEIAKLWRTAKAYEGKGEWEKVLKRFYRLAGSAGGRIYRQRAKRDLLDNPGLAERITAYLRATGSAAEYLKVIENIWKDAEQPYADVNSLLAETLLRLEPERNSAIRIRRIAAGILTGRYKFNGSIASAPVAPLLILRFGDRRSLQLLRNCFERDVDRLPLEVVRSAAVVFASYGIREFRIIRRAAGRLLRSNLGLMVRLIERVVNYQEVPGSYKARLNLRYDAVVGRKYIDMRSVLAARILALNRRSRVRSWLYEKRRELLRERTLSPFDRELIQRLIGL